MHNSYDNENFQEAPRRQYSAMTVKFKNPLPNVYEEQPRSQRRKLSKSSRKSQRSVSRNNSNHQTEDEL